MARPRTTACGLEHYGGPCAPCSSERKRRSRARGLPEKRSLDERQRDEVRARAYVFSYLRRGAIVPDAACARCYDLMVEELPATLASVVPFHPDPLRRREVAWLCPPCRRVVSATREPVTSTWIWPGGFGVASASADVSFMSLGDIGMNLALRLPQLSAHARREVQVGTWLASLDVSVLQGLLARGRRGGVSWKPTDDFAMNGVLRMWVLRESWRLFRISHDNAPVVLCSIPARDSARSCRSAQPPHSNEPQLMVPMNDDLRASRMDEASRRLDAANALADEINARVSANLHARMRA